MDQRGEHCKAYKFALDSLEVREILLPPDETDICDSLTVVAMAQSSLGRYEEASMMYKRAVVSQERVLGADHLHTLISRINLAELFGRQGQYRNAERMLKQILEVVSQKESEAGRSARLATLRALVTVYISLGRYREAADLEPQILKARESKLGSEHPTTVAVKGDLAYTYRQLGRIKEAEELTLQNLRIQEANHHAETEILVTRAHLASSYLRQGRWSLAETLQLDILTTTRSKLGPNHPDTFYAMGNLALTYWTQGRFHEAEALRLQLLDLRKALLGENYPATLDTKAALVATYRSLSRYAESVDLTRSVLEICTATLGDSHPLTVDSKICLASAYRGLKEAQMIEEGVLVAGKRDTRT